MPDTKNTTKDSTLSQVVQKLNGADNILVALSVNPSVDEMAAAIGLTLFLDKIGKHATAIYSGATPNALEFLNPTKTFESDTSSLQDFIIALDKEKADHLRYKVDGQYVKVFVTPYRTTITENDLEFSHGEFNVDLVVALNVKAATELDGALREHGRIMHDASAINITTEAPGKFGEIEWSNGEMSSVSEMVASLVYALPNKDQIDEEIATALLAGIVVSTERFSNDRTKPDTMNLAARLMESGADQQLVSQNIAGGSMAMPTAPREADATELSVAHGEEASAEEQSTEPTLPEVAPAEQTTEPVAEKKLEPTPEEQLNQIVQEPTLNGDLMAELKKAADLAAQPEPEPVDPNARDYGKMIDEALAENLAAAAAPEVSETPELPEYNDMPKKVLQPISPDLPLPTDEILPPPPTPPVDFSAPVEPLPDVNVQPIAPAMPTVPAEPVAPAETPVMPAAPAVPVAPVAPAEPVMPTPIVGEGLPPVASAQTVTEPIAPAVAPTAPQDPSAFKIPGM